MQLDLNRMEDWTHANKMKFNRDKCKVLHLGSKNQLYKYQMSETWVGNATYEKGLRVLETISLI